MIKLTRSHYALAAHVLREHAMRVRTVTARSTSQSRAWNAGVAQDAEDAALAFEHFEREGWR